jgi:hypothetical protein
MRFATIFLIIPFLLLTLSFICLALFENKIIGIAVLEVWLLYFGIVNMDALTIVRWLNARENSRT